jgi:hypothetical protein
MELQHSANMGTSYHDIVPGSCHWCVVWAKLQMTTWMHIFEIIVVTQGVKWLPKRE